MARILPDRSATPKRVREYLAQTLTAKHDVPFDRATELALSWDYGRGSDLRDATSLDLELLLGDSLGRYLFNSVCEDKYLEWRQSTAGVLYRYAAFGAISALLLSIAYAYKDLSLQTSDRACIRNGFNQYAATLDIGMGGTSSLLSSLRNYPHYDYICHFVPMGHLVHCSDLSNLSIDSSHFL